MDLFGLTSLPTWLVIILSFFISLLLYSIYELTKLRRLGYTGPIPVPFLGNMITFGRKGFDGAMDEWIKKYGKVYGSYLCHVPAIWVADIDMIKEICVSDFSTFSDRPQIIDTGEPMNCGLTNVNGHHWKYVRSVMSPTFSSVKLRKMIPAIHDVCDTLIPHLREKGKDGKSIDFKDVFSAYTMDVIASTAFGIQVDSLKNPEDPFVKNGKKLMGGNRLTSPLFLIALMFPFLSSLLSRLGLPMFPKDSLDFFINVTKAAIKDRKKEDAHRSDFLQLALNAQHERVGYEDRDGNKETEEFADYKERGLTDNEILANALLFFLAGFDTTSNHLTFTVYALATNPDVQEKLIDEIDNKIGKEKPTYEMLKSLTYLQMCMEESHRLYPIASITSRCASKDAVLNGYTFPKGVSILIPIHAFHKDPALWPDPEKFDPERFTPENKVKQNPIAYMPFGAGPRNCIGLRLAQLESKLAVVSILQNFRIQTAPDTEIPPKTDGSGLLRPKNGMWLRLEPR